MVVVMVGRRKVDVCVGWTTIVSCRRLEMEYYCFQIRREKMKTRPRTSYYLQSCSYLLTGSWNMSKLIGAVHLALCPTTSLSTFIGTTGRHGSLPKMCFVLEHFMQHTY